MRKSTWAGMGLGIGLLITLAKLMPPTVASAIDVTSCGQAINVAGATYVLQNDITCNGTGLTISAANIILDLNGHTITYDNAQSGITNKGFETGTGTVPDDWDLTGCPGCQRTLANDQPVAVGSYRLNFTSNGGLGALGDSIVSPLITMPANRACIVSYIEPVPPFQWTYSGSVPANMPIFHYCVVDNANTIITQGYTNGSSTETFGFTTTAATQYRLRWRLTTAPTMSSQYGYPLCIDELNICTGSTSDPSSNATYGVTGTIASTGATVRNGTIIQGLGNGETNYGVRMGASGWIIDNLTIHTTGTNSFGIMGNFTINVEVKNCNVTTDSPAVHKRADLGAAIFVGRTTGTYIHNNTITTGRSLIGALTSGNSGANENNHISTNTINSTCPITNHHAIVVFGSQNAHVDNNTITCTYGQGGILLSTGFSGAEVDHNTITMAGIEPNIEYGWLDFDAIRMNSYSGTASNLNIHDNTITITGKNNPAFLVGGADDCSITPMPTSGCAALNGILDSSHGTNNLIQNNTVTVTLDVGATCMGSAFTFGNSSTVGGTTWLNNTMASNNVIITLGDYAPQAHWEVIRGNTLRKITPVVNDYHTVDSQRPSATVNAVRFVGNTLVNGASLNDPRIYVTQPWDYTIENPLTVLVKTPTGTPVSGTAVVVTDSASAIVASGTTDVNGSFSADILYQSLSGPQFNTSTITTVTKRSHLISVAGNCPAQRVVMDRPRQVSFVSGTYTLPSQNSTVPVEFIVTAPTPVVAGDEFWVNCRVKADDGGIGAGLIRSLRGEILYDSTKVMPVQWDISTSSLDSIFVSGGVSYHTINPPVPVADDGSFTDGARPICTSFAGQDYNKAIKLIQWANAAGDVNVFPVDAVTTAGGRTIGRMRFRAIAAGTTKFAWTCDGIDAGSYTAGGITGPRAWLQDQFFGGRKIGGGWTSTPSAAITITGTFDPCSKWSSHPNCSEYGTSISPANALINAAQVHFLATGDSLVGGQIPLIYPSAFTFTSITGVRSGWSASVAASSSSSITCPGSKVIYISFCRTAGQLESLLSTGLFDVNFICPTPGQYQVKHPCAYDATEKAWILAGTRAASMRLTALSSSAAQRYDYTQDGNVQVNP